MVKDGFSSIFVRLFFNNKEVTDNVTKLKYVYDEENDDDITVEFEVDNREAPDQPQYQPKAELVVIWGYIGGETKKRKIYVEDPAWAFSKDCLKCTLYCSEKGTILKGSTDNIIYKSKSLPEIVKDKADKHGLKGYVELEVAEDKTRIEPLPGESLSQYFIREKQKQISDEMEEYRKNPQKARVDIDTFLNNAAKASNDPIAKKERELREKYQRDWEEGNPVNVEAAVERDLNIFKASQQFKIYKNQPQANRSDKQFLESVAKREPNGPYMVETRDDEIIIKRRKYTGAPIIAYTFGDPSGEFIDFNPQTKRKSRKGNSTGMGFSGWNPLDKTFFQGTATAADGDPSLAKAMEMLKYYKGIQARGGGTLVTGTRVGREVLPYINDYNIASKIDKAGIYTRIRQTTEITVDDQVSALDKAINEFTTTKDARRKEMYNALGLNPTDSYEHANNLRRNSEINKNPATLLVWGNPILETGMIITILGVGKKYSGNYYIKKAVHDLSKSGYTTELEMVRQGDNIKTNDDYADGKEIGRPLNSKIAPKDNPKPTKIVGTKSNPKNNPPKIGNVNDLLK